MAAPLRGQGGPYASSTSILSSIPLRGRASLSRPALGRSPSAGDTTTDGLQEPFCGAAANGNPTFPARIPPSALEYGDLSVAQFLRWQGLDWELADGRFVKTGCPHYFSSFRKDMTEAVVRIPIFAFIGGCWCPVEGARIVGRVRTDTCSGTPYAAFTMVGLTEALADMGVEEYESVMLVVEREEGGRILRVGLRRVDPGAQGLGAAAATPPRPPAAPEQVHEMAEEVGEATAPRSARSGVHVPVQGSMQCSMLFGWGWGHRLSSGAPCCSLLLKCFRPAPAHPSTCPQAPKAAAAVAATAVPSAATGSTESFKSMPGPRTNITVGGNTEIKCSTVYMVRDKGKAPCC